MSILGGKPRSTKSRSGKGVSKAVGKGPVGGKKMVKSKKSKKSKKTKKSKK